MNALDRKPVLPGGIAMGGLALLVGSMGTWVDTPLLSVSGSDGIGWLGAFLSALVIITAGTHAFGGRPRRLWLPTLAVGIGGVAFSFVLWLTLRAFGPASWLWNLVASQTEALRDFDDIEVSTGWGLYTMFLASLGLTGCGLAALVLRGSDDRASAKPTRGSGTPVSEVVPAREDHLL